MDDAQEGECVGKHTDDDKRKGQITLICVLNIQLDHIKTTNCLIVAFVNYGLVDFMFCISDPHRILRRILTRRCCSMYLKIKH